MTSVTGAVFGFYWPITVATATTATAMYLYCTAVRNSQDPRRSAGLAVGGVLALGVGLAPLAPTVGGVRCTEDGHLRTFDPEWALVALLMCVTLVGLWLLFMQAGNASSESWIPAIVTVLVTGGGLVFEFALSETTAEVSCGSGAPVSYGQVGAAILIAVVTGAAIRVGLLQGSHR